MAKAFAEYAQERRDRMGADGGEAERVFRAYYASLMAEDTRAAAIQDSSEPHD